MSFVCYKTFESCAALPLCIPLWFERKKSFIIVLRSCLLWLFFVWIFKRNSVKFLINKVIKFTIKQIVILNSELNSDRDVDCILCWQNVNICTELLVQYPIKINQLPSESKRSSNLCYKVFKKKSSVEKITLSEFKISCLK